MRSWHNVQTQEADRPCNQTSELDLFYHKAVRLRIPGLLPALVVAALTTHEAAFLVHQRASALGATAPVPQAARGQRRGGRS